MVATLIVAVAFLVSGAGDAAGAWQALGDLGPPGSYAAQADAPVAIAPNGRAVFVWEENQSVYARSFKPGGAPDWVTVVALDASNPVVAVDGKGTATVAWKALTRSRIETRTISASGVMSPVEAVSTPDIVPVVPELKVTPSGYALFTWLAERERPAGDLEAIQVRSRSNGVLGPVQNIDVYRNPNGQALHGDCAIRSNGAAVCAWYRFGPPDLIRSRRRGADGKLAPIRTVASDAAGGPGRLEGDLAVGLDHTGAATVAFVRYDCRSSSSCFSRVLTRVDRGPLKNVSPVGQPAFLPQLAIDGQGDTLFMWKTPAAVKARGRSAPGSFGPVQTIAGRSMSPSLAVSRTGAAVFGWMRIIKLGMFDQPSTVSPRVRTRSAGGVLGPPTTLSDPVTDNAPRIGAAMNAGGRAAAMWDAGNVERGALGP